MAGLTTAVRNGLFNLLYNSGADLTGTDYAVTEYALVTTATGNTAGGAVASEITLTGYSRASHSAGLFGSPVDGAEESDAALSFGTVPQGSGSQTATHVAALNAAGAVRQLFQLVSAGGIAAAPLVIDSTNGDVVISIPVGDLDVTFSAPADV